MKSTVSAALALSALLAPGIAHADGKAACLDAAARSQKLRNAHQLVEARDQLRICAAAECPSVIQTDCVNWLSEVEKSLPGVVVAAKSASGADLVDVKVSVDGKPLLSKLTGQAVPMDAGPHVFHFETPDGSSLDQQVLVREGVKDQAVSVVFKGAAGGGAPGAAVPSDGTASSPLRTAGWVVGGVGVAGLAAGLVAGIVAIEAKSSAGCTGDLCNGSPSGVKSASLASDIGWITGGVLVAAGAGLVLFAPRARSTSAAAVRVLPVMVANGGRLVVGGTF
jgi:hypothetical protein